MDEKLSLNVNKYLSMVLFPCTDFRMRMISLDLTAPLLVEDLLLHLLRRNQMTWTG